MKIKQIHERLRAVDEKFCHPKDENDVKSATSEFYQLQRELEDKGFPLNRLETVLYSVAYGYGTIRELNEKSRTVYGGCYNFCGSCIG